MPAVSVLIATFNRSRLLRRALASVLKQDFLDYEIVVIDDCSEDDTPQVMAAYADPRIRYVRNEVNVGAAHGDRAHLRRFVNELARGEYFVYLCDDDFWVPSDLLGRQVEAMRRYPSLAMAIGGQVQIYPGELLRGDDHADRLANILDPEEADLFLDGVPADAKIAFVRGLFPAGFMASDTYLDLFARDPAGRNLVVGATLFSRKAFLAAHVFEDTAGSKWQAGYELLAGAATAGDVFYIDEPCVASLVDLGSASFRGNQYQHLTDCLLSMEIAFRNGSLDAGPEKTARLTAHRRKMMHAIVFAFVMNKITYRFGGFATHSIAALKEIFRHEIASDQFRDLIRRYDIPLWFGNKVLLWLSGLPAFAVYVLWYSLANQLGPYWHQTAMSFPSAENDRVFRSSLRYYLTSPKGWAQLVFPASLRVRLRNFAMRIASGFKRRFVAVLSRTRRHLMP